MTRLCIAPLDLCRMYRFGTRISFAILSGGFFHKTYGEKIFLLFARRWSWAGFLRTPTPCVFRLGRFDFCPPVVFCDSRRTSAHSFFPHSP